MTPEGKVKYQARKLAKDLGVYTFPVNQQGIGRRGIPDDLVIVHGQVMFVEFKAHINWERHCKTAFATMPTLLQIFEMDRIRLAGGMTLVVDDSNFVFYEKYLRRLQAMQDVSELSNAVRWEITMQDFEKYRDMSDKKIKAFKAWCSYYAGTYCTPQWILKNRILKGGSK